MKDKKYNCKTITSTTPTFPVHSTKLQLCLYWLIPYQGMIGQASTMTL